MTLSFHSILLVIALSMVNYSPVIQSTRTQQQPTWELHLLLFGLCEAPSEVEEKDQEEWDIPATGNDRAALKPQAPTLNFKPQLYLFPTLLFSSSSSFYRLSSIQLIVHWKHIYTQWCEASAGQSLHRAITHTGE